MKVDRRPAATRCGALPRERSPSAHGSRLTALLSDRLKRLQPTLAARGVLIDSGRTKAGRYLEMTRTLPPAPHEQSRAF